MNNIYTFFLLFCYCGTIFAPIFSSPWYHIYQSFSYCGTKNYHIHTIFELYICKLYSNNIHIFFELYIVFIAIIFVP